MGNKLFWYTIYGKTLCSQIEYPFLLTTTNKEADIIIELVHLQRKTQSENESHVDPITKERIYFCNQVGVYEITKGRLIHVCPNSGVPIEQLTPFIFGYCISMLFWQLGMLAVHCSAVEWNHQALLIAGNSGSGKSTLTSRLLDCGCRLMADDVAILDASSANDIIVSPAFPRQKLCRDALLRNQLKPEDHDYIDEERDKFSISRDNQFCQEASNLKGIVFLEVSSHKHIIAEDLKAGVKLTALLENLFLFPMFRSSQSFSGDDMMKCLRIAQEIPMYRIKRPYNLDSTKEQSSFVFQSIFEEKGKE